MSKCDSKIFFDKPNYRLLGALGYSSVDMHFHTRYSDARTKIRDVLDRCSAENLGVAITDHNAIGGAIEAFEKADGQLIIPGIEVSCFEGPHMLFYFYKLSDLEHFYNRFLKKRLNSNPYMRTGAKITEILDYSERFDCLRVAAHPYVYTLFNNGLQTSIDHHYVDDDIKNGIDGFEAINAGIPRRFNIKAHDLVLRSKKAFTAGSDGHTLMELGNAVTCCKSDNIKGFLDAIRKKGNLVIGKETRALPKILATANCVRSHMHYAVPTAKIQSRRIYSMARHMKGGVLNKLRNQKSKIAKRVHWFSKKE